MGYGTQIGQAGAQQVAPGQREPITARLGLLMQAMNACLQEVGRLEDRLEPRPQKGETAALEPAGIAGQALVLTNQAQELLVRLQGLVASL